MTTRRLIRQWAVLGPFLRESRNLLDQNRHLNELHILEGRIPEDMSIHDNQSGPGESILEERRHGDVVPRHDAIEDIMLTLHIGAVDSSVGKINQLFIQTYVLATFEKCRASIHEFGLLFGHRFCPGLRPKHPPVVIIRQLSSEKLIVAFHVDLLQAHDVRVMVSDFIKNDVLSIIP